MVATPRVLDLSDLQLPPEPLRDQPVPVSRGCGGYEEYHPFGSTSWHAHNSSITARKKRYRYTGKEKDEETGLCYHGARYYAPWLGRWCSADPAGMVDGPNRYAYGRNNPVGGRDPTGTRTVDDERVQVYDRTEPVLVNGSPHAEQPNAPPSSDVVVPVHRGMGAASRGAEAIGQTGPTGGGMTRSTGRSTGRSVSWGLGPRGGESLSDFFGRAGTDLSEGFAAGAGESSTTYRRIGAFFGEMLPFGHAQTGAMRAIGQGESTPGNWLLAAGPLMVGGSSRGTGTLAGSGPAKGFIELSDSVKSSAAVRNFHGKSPVDFVYDSRSRTFIMGNNPAGHDGAAAAGRLARDKGLVGGRLSRDANGRLVTDEWSGHYGMNWTDEIRADFRDFMSSRVPSASVPDVLTATV